MIGVCFFKVKVMPNTVSLPQTPKLNLQQSTDRLTQSRLGNLEHLLVVLPANPGTAVWRELPFGNLLKRLLRRRPVKSAVPALTAHLPNSAQTGVSLALLDGKAAMFDILTMARKLVKDAVSGNPASIGILVLGFADKKPVFEAMVTAILASDLQLPQFKSKPPPTPRLRTVRLLGLDTRLDLKRVVAEAEGNNLARWLTAMPPNELTPKLYRGHIESLAHEHGWQMEYLDEKTLKRKNAGAFLAVCQGSAARDAGIARLRYSASTDKKGKIRPGLALVGKGICFDTGGTNLKPFKSMLGMHEDMQGSAVALGVLVALTRLQVDFDVECWLALSENRIGANAYKSQDIVTTVNGVTIQVIHTDAEGRMALADTLALASESEPRLMLDFATLTGSCVAALTNRYSGVFSNRENVYPELADAGRASGERVWPFPMDADYDADLESPVADLVQCPTGNSGDHIFAARFLNRFVPDSVPWVHMDLSAGNCKGGLAHVPTDVTGFGVRYTVHLVLDRRLQDSLAQ